MSCAHLRAAPAADSDAPRVCDQCAEIGFTEWVHLRRCVSCGQVGCCDSSPHRHASRHFEATGHPVMQSHEPGESWRWCFVDERIG